MATQCTGGTECTGVIALEHLPLESLYESDHVSVVWEGCDMTCSQLPKLL